MSKRNETSSILINDYNRVVAKSQNLQEQLVQKQAQWTERDKFYKAIEDNIRDLCEDILAKDSKEMTLGDTYCWAKVGIQELIEKARVSYKQYNAERSNLMQRMLDTSEERRAMIEGLKEQLEYVSTHGGATISTEDIEKRIKKEKDDAKAKEKVSNGIIKSKANNGDVNLIVEDDVDTILEEAANIQNADAIQKAFNEAKSNRINSLSIPHKQSDKKMKMKNDADRQNAKSYFVTEKEVMSKINEVGFAILEIMGEKGSSLGPEITQNVINKEKLSKGKIDLALGRLVSNNVIEKTPIKLPTGNITVYKFTSIGSGIFNLKFGHKPSVVCEADRIITEHGSLQHGYSIKALWKILKDNNIYSNVSMYNRKNAISVDGSKAKSFIPDIVCKVHGKQELHLEYETGTTPQAAFSAKCAKIVENERRIDFVVAGVNQIEKFAIPRVNEWVKERIKKKGKDSLTNIKVRITTIVKIRNEQSDLSIDADWNVVYDFNKSIEPQWNKELTE